MAKWQSKAQIAEQEYQSFYKHVYPELEAKMKVFIASYDENQPVEESMKTLANSPVALLCRRMAKYCVWPAVREYGVSVSFQSRLVAESIDRFAKPMQDEYNTKKRVEEKARREAFKVAAQSRVVVVDGLFRRSSNLGESVIVNDENGTRVLICLSCEYIKADEDMGQFDSGYYCKFAEPTEEEKATPEYQRAQSSVEQDQAIERAQKKRFEARRQADLDAIRATGREPDFFEDLFAGTSDD